MQGPSQSGNGGGGGRSGSADIQLGSSDAWSAVKAKAAEQQEISQMKQSLTFDALFKRYELAKAFQLDKDQVRRDAQRVKARLYAANRCLLNPDSAVMQSWDLLTIFALLFTLLVSPYEIGFLDSYEGIANVALFYINQSVTCIFAIDMLFNFFRPYRDALSQKVKSHRKIAKAYLTSWFIVDVVSTVPIDVIVVVLQGGDPTSNSNTDDAASKVKMIRLMRLLKLFRIVRASRVFARWADRIEHYISISHATRTLLWWSFMLLVTIHWFCCCWGLVAQLQGTQRSDELTALVSAKGCFPDELMGCLPPGDPMADEDSLAQCRDTCLNPCELRHQQALQGWNEDLTFRNENWICRAILTGHIPKSGDEHFYRFTYVASGTSTNIVGQISPQNVYEYICGFIMAFAWTMILNSFIGILCGTIADGDRHAKEYKQRMDELNYFLRDMQAPQDLAIRAREHCRSTRGLFKKKEYQKLFLIMSPMLRGDLAQQMSMRTLENVWYFSACEPELLRSLSERLQPLGFARAEKIYYEERINIVSKGAAARGGKILTVDCYWGEDMIVTSPALKDTRYASALTYVELTCVTREDLEDCLVHFPKTERKIRVTALKIAMQRAGQIIAHHLQTRARAKQLSGALSKLDPSNSLFTEHAKEQTPEQMLKEMMNVVNGGRKLRVFDSQFGQIVDETSNIIDDDYVRTMQTQSRLSTDKALQDLRERVTDLQTKGEVALAAERTAIAEERRSMAEERDMYRRMLNGEGAGVTRHLALPRPRDASPTGTLTPPEERRRQQQRLGSKSLRERKSNGDISTYAKAGREAAGIAAACKSRDRGGSRAGTPDFSAPPKGEKRYRRVKKKDRASTPGADSQGAASPDLEA